MPKIVWRYDYIKGYDDCYVVTLYLDGETESKRNGISAYSLEHAIGQLIRNYGHIINLDIEEEKNDC